MPNTSFTLSQLLKKEIASAQDKTVVTNPHKNMTFPSGKKDYNFDFDEDVETFLRDMEASPEIKMAYIKSMQKLLEEVKKGNYYAKEYFSAFKDVLNKKYPKDFRAAGRKAVVPNDLDIKPDFGKEAINGEDDVDKEYRYEGLLGHYRRLYKK